jgi:NADPH2:quinone reductase
MWALVVERVTPDFSGCRLQRIPIPQPRPGEILVRIRAASVGFPDLLMTRGAYQHKPPLPFVPGADIAGEVVAIGKGVTTHEMGHRVVATRMGGGFAQFGLYRAEELRAMPAVLSFPSASAYGAAYLTAYVALVRRANIEPGESVLIHGSTGGVGLAAVDLAKTLGARVFATSGSDEKLQVVDNEYAPAATINNRRGFKERVKELTEGRGADVIFDPVGGGVFHESVGCIAFGGRLLVVGFASGEIPTLSVNLPLIKGFSVIGVRAGEYGRRYPLRGVENLDTIWKLAAEGRTRPRVHTQLPLSDWREAFAAMESRAVIGRVVILPN